MIRHFRLLAIAATFWIYGAQSQCPQCTGADKVELCKKAIQRWEANGIFETSGSALIARTAKSGDLTCIAQMKCDSSGGKHRFVGNDVRNWFGSIKASCGVCGDGVVPSASNCWLQVLTCQNCNIPEEGKPVQYLTSSVRQPVPQSSTKKSTVVSSRAQGMTTTTRKQTTIISSKKPSPSSSTKRSTTTRKTSNAPVSSPTTVKKTTKTPSPPTTTKKPNPPSSTPTPKPQPDQEEKDTDDATSANDNYQKEPTNSSLAKKLADAIKKALESVKKAVETAANESIKGAELGLQHALEDALVSASAAVSGPTAAAAAAVAAAMKGVSSSKDAVKKAKQQKPTKPPTTSFSKPSRTTTTASSSTGGCVCLKCGLDGLNFGHTPEEKRSTSSTDIRRGTKKLAERSGRKTGFCSYNWDVPDYDSWDGSDDPLRPPVNPYHPFYDSSYTLNMASCSDVDFDLISPATGIKRHNYATEHVYEIQMIKHFLTWMWDNDAALQDWKGNTQVVHNNDPCMLWESFLMEDANQNAWWDRTVFPEHLFEYVLRSLSGGTRTQEMVYLEENMNTIKGVMFGLKKSLITNTWEKQLAAAVETATLIHYLRAANVVNIYGQVSQRMHQVWMQIDNQLQLHQQDPDLQRVNFANGYLRWEARYIASLENEWSTRPGRDAKLAEDQLRKGVGIIEKKVADNIRTQRTAVNGKLNSINLTFANGLLGWFVGQRP